MSAPLDVEVSNTSDSTMTVCWSPPAHGLPQGYLLTYTPALAHQSYSKGSLNHTMAQLQSKVIGSNGSLDEEQTARSGVEMKRYCAIVDGLVRWTEYLVGVRAWSGDQVSMAATPILATTRSDYCAEGVCGVSNCTLQKVAPGYSCDCHLGYYGHDCQHHNPCLSHNPCQHFGKCQNASDGTYTCECLRSFYGPNCSQIDPCAAISSNPCSNGGTCIRSQVPQYVVRHESGKYRCLCPGGFYGVTCEKQNPCFSSPCQHAGSCINLTDTHFICRCAPGYTGVECEENIDDCGSSPCVNGATCVDGVAAFTCSCTPGYTGKLCQAEIDECASNPCVRGQCTDHINDFHCKCPKGWSGKICNEDLDECASSPCFNGATCNDGMASFYCDCDHGYSGEKCEIPESCPAQNTTHETGEFQWPATRHGESVTVTCPFGNRTSASENISSKISSLVGASSTSAITDDYLTTSININNKSLEYENGSVVHSTSLPPSPEFTTRAAWDDRNFHINRQIRNLEFNESSQTFNPITVLSQVNNESARRRAVAANLRGSHPKQLRRLQPRGDSERADQTKRVTERQAEGEQEPQSNVQDGSERRQIQYRGSGIRRLRVPKQTSIEELPLEQQTQIGDENVNGSNNQEPETTTPSSVRQCHLLGAVRSCVLLPNGTAVWSEPDICMCRGRAMQEAEDAAKNVSILTASPASVNSKMFTDAANQLAILVKHALQDPEMARSMVSALSNMMDVNDSVIAAGDKKNNVTSQLVKTINTFTENVAVEIGKPVHVRSNNLVLEARMLESSASGVMFSPELEMRDGISDGTTRSRRRRNKNSSNPSLNNESFLKLPPQVLKMSGKKHVRLEFVSYSNDKFFRGQRALGMPVITAKVTNTVISNLSEPIVYHIPTEADEAFRPVCVFWDELAHDWSKDGMRTVIEEGTTTCEAMHLTAFSILLDPLPSSFGVHAQALSVITYVGLALSTAGLTATVATYAIFRTLNRDRSGKIVMNLSLALLLLNSVFIIAAQLEPPSVACTVLAAALHYLVVAAFAWMLVEAANMYQLLITVFASAETHFMAKRVTAAWGFPVVAVIAAVIADADVYGDKEHGFCVISPIPNPAVYYSTYMGPICCVLLMNCIVFVMVTRVLCQRRPHSHKPRSPTYTPAKELPITLAQVRGAVTVVALLGVTWVAGAVSIGWARLAFQYVFCLTTPLQGLIIFIVRVAQHPEARAAWIALFTTGTLRRRPPTQSTHSSAHTHSTTSSALTPPRNNHSSVRTVSTRVSLRTSIKPSASVKRNGSAKHSSNKNGSIHRYTSSSGGTESTHYSMSTIFSRLVNRFANNSIENHKSKIQEDKTYSSPCTAKPVPAAVNEPDYLPLSHHKSFFSETLEQKTHYHSNKNESLYRPQSLVVLQADSHGGVSANNSSLFSKDSISCQFPAFLPNNTLSKELLEAGIPPSMVPRRSLGSLTLLTAAKEGDDSSWHFVRPPPDGRSDPVNVEKIVQETDNRIIPQKEIEDRGNINSARQPIRAEEPLKSDGCVVLSGHRVATSHSVVLSGQRNSVFSPTVLTRANSELQMSSPHINPNELRRSASVYTLGEWEDPRSSLA
nr:uncharacterized protein LOC123767978 isoform X2 [Procambarus clarkii]